VFRDALVFEALFSDAAAMRSRYWIDEPERPHFITQRGLQQFPILTCLLSRAELTIVRSDFLRPPQENDQDRFQDPFQSETLPGGREQRQGQLVELSCSAKEREREAPVARDDGDRRHPQWLPFSSHPRARRPKKSLVQSGPEVERSCGGRGGRRCHAGHRAGGRGTGAHGAVRFEKSSRSRGPEGAGVVVGPHTHCAQRLGPLDHLRQAARNARAPDQKCLLDARCREATRLLLRPVWVLQ